MNARAFSGATYRDLDAGQVSVRWHTGGPQGAKLKAEVIADILQSIKDRRACAGVLFWR